MFAMSCDTSFSGARSVAVAQPGHSFLAPGDQHEVLEGIAETKAGSIRRQNRFANQRKTK
jgi:hypothetical protein